MCGNASRRVEAMRGWEWAPRFALEYVELDGVVLYHGFKCFMLMSGCTFCWWRLHVGFDACAGCWGKIRGGA